MIDVLDQLAERFPEVLWDESHGETIAVVARDAWAEFAGAVREAGFEMCADVTVVDWLRSREDRFQVVANLVSLTHAARVRMVTAVGRDDPVVASLTPIWPGANFAEREAYDMFGVAFEGHPDLTRILMPDDWEGHPLRKDYGTGSVPVQFKESPKAS